MLLTELCAWSHQFIVVIGIDLGVAPRGEPILAIGVDGEESLECIVRIFLHDVICNGARLTLRERNWTRINFAAGILARSALFQRNRERET